VLEREGSHTLRKKVKYKNAQVSGKNIFNDEKNQEYAWNHNIEITSIPKKKEFVF